MVFKSIRDSLPALIEIGAGLPSKIIPRISRGLMRRRAEELSLLSADGKLQLNVSRRSLLPGRFTQILAAVAGAATLLAACSSAGSPSVTKTACGAVFGPRVERDLQTVATVARRTYQIPGIIIAVTVPGEGCWVSASGLADTAGGVRLRLTDEFPIGSITKTFTATVILQLARQGKLSLSAPVSTWVPYVQGARHITVAMLLNMTSGIYDEPAGPLAEQMSADPGQVWSPQQVVRFAVAHGPGARPGRFYYSNTNYIILGMIAQAVTGEPIQTLITNRILHPLHLTHTSFPAATTPPVLTAQGYFINQGVAGVTTAADSSADISVSGAAGAMISTAGDLQIWARALATGALLSPAIQRQQLSFDPMSGPGFAPLPGTSVLARLPFRYGLGIYSIGGLLGYNGVAFGYTTDMFYLSARKATIIVLANGDNLQFDASHGGDVSTAAAVSTAEIVLQGALITQD
jgi:D-alanyl-D-alanine carboxypeptidase